MSCSSMYGIKKDYSGEKIADFKNSWLFSPVVWDVLSEKYLPKLWGFTQSVISSPDAFKQVNNIMNNSKNLYERICWEFSNQQIFFTKDKQYVIDAVNEFLDKNSEYKKDEEDGIAVLKREHIVERWHEIRDTIDGLDEEEYPYFVFKCTSCDDSVERWFSKYNEETEEYDECTLKDNTDFCAEFVVITDGVIQFISNVKFKYE